MKKKCLTVLTAMCLAVSNLSMPASLGMNVQAEGILQLDFQYWVLEDGTVEITSYTGTQEKVVVPGEIDGKQVTSIGNYVFAHCSNLSEITLPDNLTSIGDSAFSWCSNLSEITLPDSLTSIGDNAFEFCVSLSEITLPDNLTSIGNGAFDNCTNLLSVKLPQGLRFIGYEAFGYKWGEKVENFKLFGYTGTMAQAYADIYGITFESLGESQSNLYVCDRNIWFFQTPEDTLEVVGYVRTSEKVEIPDEVNGKKVSSIGDCAFYGGNLSEINLPDSVTSIGDRAFSWCSNLSEITLPDNLTSIGDSTFQNCSNLSEITLPDNLTSIGELTFAYCGNLSEITLPDNLTSIGDSAFIGCSNLSEITLPDNLTSIGDSAFKFCDNLSKIILPAHLTTIKDGAFFNCKLSEIELPNTLTEIGVCAVGYQYISGSYVKILDFKIYGYAGTVAEDYARVNGFTFIDLEKPQDNPSPEPEEPDVDNPNPEPEEPDVDNPSPDFQYDVLEDGTVEITSYTGNEEKVVVPGEIDGKQVTSIGDWAFYWLGLSEIELPNNLTSIGEGAFYGCNGLSKITLPNSLTSIGDKAFGFCYNLSEITLPNSLLSIGDWAFSDCDFSEIKLPNSVTNIGKYAFGYSSAATPEGVYFKYPNFKIYGYAGTAVETYAKENEFAFIDLEKPQETPSEDPTEETTTEEATTEEATTEEATTEEATTEEVTTEEATTKEATTEEVTTEEATTEEATTEEVTTEEPTTEEATTEEVTTEEATTEETTTEEATTEEATTEEATTEEVTTEEATTEEVTTEEVTTEEPTTEEATTEEVTTEEATTEEVTTEEVTTEEVTTEETTTEEVTTKDESTTENTTSGSETTTTEESTTEQTISTTESVYVSEKVSLDKSAFTALLEKNQKQDVQIASNDRITFRFAKGSMKEVANMAMYDFTSTVNDKYEELKDSTRKVISKENLAFVVSYNYSGSLPAEAEITIQAGKEYAGKTLYYYLCKEDGSLQFMQEAKVDADGNMTVKQNHCSDYVVLKTKLPAKNTEDVKTGDSSPAAPMVLAMAAAMLTVVGMCRKKVKA